MIMIICYITHIRCSEITNWFDGELDAADPWVLYGLQDICNDLVAPHNWMQQSSYPMQFLASAFNWTNKLLSSKQCSKCLVNSKNVIFLYWRCMDNVNIIWKHALLNHYPWLNFMLDIWKLCMVGFVQGRWYIGLPRGYTNNFEQCSIQLQQNIITLFLGTLYNHINNSQIWRPRD